MGRRKLMSVGRVNEEEEEEERRGRGVREMQRTRRGLSGSGYFVLGLNSRTVCKTTTELLIINKQTIIKEHERRRGDENVEGRKRREREMNTFRSIL